MDRQEIHDGLGITERAAQYVRMSTEHQKYSTANQAQAIAEYAAFHSLKIVRTYADEGKSGLNFEGREALKQLIADVVSGEADFGTILVYDVSRWGRFQDNDEGAYYEFICKKAGVMIRYCTEPFENDASMTSSIVKSMKRAMAAEYSRELSRKVFYGQCRITRLGYFAGGTTPYALRRLLVNAGGNPIAQLERGQHKAMSDDRVILVPGPPEEVETVQEIFHQFVHERKSPDEISMILNAGNVPTLWGKPWRRQGIRNILRNEVYIGNCVYNRRSTKLKTRGRQNPPEEWIRATGAFMPIVSVELFETARSLFKRKKSLSKDKMLNDLRALLKQKGRLSAQLINNAENIPSARAYCRKFGSLRNAYRIIDYTSDSLQFKIGEAADRTRILLKSLVPHVITSIAPDCKSIRADTNRFLIVIDEKATIMAGIASLRRPTFARVLEVSRPSVRPDFVLAMCLDEANQSVSDYYFFPASKVKGKTFRLNENNHSYWEPYRHKSLEFLTEFVANGCTMIDHAETDRAVSERCKKLRLVMEYSQSSSFAKFLEVSPQRWNNVEIGMPLSKDLAMTLVRKIPGLTLDWLYRGLSEGLSPEMAKRLCEEITSLKKTTRPRRLS